MNEMQFLALEGNINEIFAAYEKTKKDFIPDLYNIIKKQSAQFTDYTYGASGRMHPWTGSVQYDEIEPGYAWQYRADKFDTGIQVDRDWYEDKEYERIRTVVQTKLDGVLTTLQYESADIFNEAFSTSKYTGPDGAALISATHHMIPGDDHQSNSGTDELTYEGHEATVLRMEGLTNDRGDKMLLLPNLVVAGPYYRDTCKKLYGSEKEAFESDNTKNIYKDFSYYIHPLITGKKWFMANKESMKGGSGLNFFMRRDPRKLERDGATAQGDFNSEKISWKSIGRWKKGWTNWFFIQGNNPA